MDGTGQHPWTSDDVEYLKDVAEHHADRRMTRLLCGRRRVVSVEGRFHSGDESWRGCGVERKGQFAVFEKTCSGEVLAADNERGVSSTDDA